MASVNPSTIISYKSAEIYFTFSFVFEFNVPYYCIVRHFCGDKGWSQGIPPDRQGKPPFLLIKKRPAASSEASREYMATCIHKELHTARNVVLQYGRFDNDTKNIVLDEFPVELQSLIRVADNGSGCVTYRITTTADTDFRRIYKVLSLSQRPDDSESSRLVVNDSVKRLYDLFAQDLFAVERDINADIDTSLCFDVKVPTEHLVQLEDREIMDFGDPLHGSSRTPTQNPYVLTILEIEPGPGCNGKMFWEEGNLEDKSTRDKQHRELTALLLRLVFPRESLNDGLELCLSRTRLPCELQDTNGGLRNYSWDSRILICFSRVSSLFACMNKSVEPERLLRNSLLDTVEILRSRWHMSILLNALLDQDMEYIKDYASEENLKALQRLIKRRKQFAYFLDDPLPYIFEGGSIIRIVDVAESEMWLEKLQELLFKKLAILDRLYEDQMKFIRTKEFQKLQSRFPTDIDE